MWSQVLTPNQNKLTLSCSMIGKELCAKPRSNKLFWRNSLPKISSKLCLKKCMGSRALVGRKWKGLGAPHFLQLCSRRSDPRQQIESKTQGKTNFFLTNFITETFLPPTYASKGVWGEREKASVLHISYHHVCFQQQQEWAAMLYSF